MQKNDLIDPETLCVQCLFILTMNVTQNEKNSFLLYNQIGKESALWARKDLLAVVGNVLHTLRPVHPIPPAPIICGLIHMLVLNCSQNYCFKTVAQYF